MAHFDRLFFLQKKIIFPQINPKKKRLPAPPKKGAQQLNTCQQASGLVRWGEGEGSGSKGCLEGLGVLGAWVIRRGGFRVSIFFFGGGGGAGVWVVGGFEE